MNHCPVYQSVGGHAYGWVYPGPMGAVLTPSYVGIENALDLPHAATLCNQCGVVCPVKIPLPELMRKLREKQYERGLRPFHERLALAGWAWLGSHPRLYSALTGIGVRMLRWMGGREQRIVRLPFGGGWTGGRDMPAPEGKTFRALYARRHTSLSRRGRKKPPSPGGEESKAPLSPGREVGREGWNFRGPSSAPPERHRAAGRCAHCK
jgi:L-lactate dehydrogenase complex protein LldF